MLRASPASAGLRARSAGVYVRTEAAGWSSWVAERSATDATLWLLTHHACTIRSFVLDISSRIRYTIHHIVPDEHSIHVHQADR